MSNDLNQYKSRLREYVEMITRHSKGGFYVCPFCGSGTKGNNGTKDGAFSIQRDGLRWHCFSCEQGGDIFDLVEAHEGCDRHEAAKKILDMFGPGRAAAPARQYTEYHKLHSSSADAALNAASITPMGGTDHEPAAPEAAPRAEVRSFRADIERYAAALPGSPAEAYLQSRGLTRETMERFRLGYDRENGGSVVIPYNRDGSYYGRRALRNFGTRHLNLDGVPVPIYNRAALSADNELVFVVESPLCAISIEQAGSPAIALAGIGYKKLIKALTEQPPAATLILCLDNDGAGRTAEAKLEKGLEGIGVTYMSGAMLQLSHGEDEPDKDGYRKDPNECLQKDGPEAFRNAIEEITSDALLCRQGFIEEAAIKAEKERKAQEEKAAEEERARALQAGPQAVDLFLQAIQTEVYRPLPIGIPAIDKAIGGGFMHGQLVLLGAAPGTGKTALCSWILETMAAAGHPCLFINLEMSREALLARSLAAATARKGYAVPVLDILRGYRWTDAQREAVIEASEEYKQRIAPYLQYNPDGVTSNVDTILEYIEHEAERSERAGLPAPICCIDYMQLLTGDPREDAAEVIKRAVYGLKQYVMKHNTVVIGIIAHNRNANSSGRVTMEAGRDTSALEYTADLQFAMVHTSCLDRNGVGGKSRDNLTPEEKKHITLKVTKARFGGEGANVDLYFDGATMTFRPITEQVAGFTPYNGSTPFTGATPYRKGKN